MSDIHTNGHDPDPSPEFALENVAVTHAPAAPVEEKRGRGRPKGSRNKVSANARRLIAEHGLGAVKTLCKIAAGQAVYASPDGSGKRVRIVPDLDQRINAAKHVLDRLVPVLKASEVDVRSLSDVAMTVSGGGALERLNERIDAIRDRKLEWERRNPPPPEPSAEDAPKPSMPASEGGARAPAAALRVVDPAFLATIEERVRSQLPQAKTVGETQ